jgi:hypothetical protein
MSTLLDDFDLDIRIGELPAASLGSVTDGCPTEASCGDSCGLSEEICTASVRPGPCAADGAQH